ncbi:MAG: AAA family ATPase [Deltaproteobacteria bacterium]|nr:AAA family ATPase [Deltaproteobacteria bacterium]
MEKLKTASRPRTLGPEELRFAVKYDSGFATTEELLPEDEFVGQERALAALELGLGVAGGRFNIFVSGLAGSERLHALQRWVASRVASAPTPGDWVYVHNFQYPDAPRAVYLRARQGVQLKQLLRNLIKTLKEDLPKAFRQEAFDKEKAQLRERYGNRAQELNAQLDRLAREKGFLVQGGPGGNVIIVPLIDGKVLQSPEEFSRLSEQERKDIDRRQHELMAEMSQLTNKQRDLIRQMEEDIRLVERRFCDNLLTPLIGAIEREIDNAEVTAYLGEVREHILDNLDDFKEAPAAPSPFAMFPMVREQDPFLEYEVNVIVDNSNTGGAPVLVEMSPSYLNLFGTIERVVDRFGRVVTNFTRIKSGSVLRAHGGYLVLSLEDALTEPAVWKTLRRTLRSRRIEMETYEPFALFSASGLKPEPVDISTKVIVVGSPLLYHLLYVWDEEFREIFKVRADFRPLMEIEESHLLAYGRWVAKLCQEEGLPHFERVAVERLLEFGARQAGDREKLLASCAEVSDLAREAAYWARKEDGQRVSARHVEQALQNRVFRSNRIEEEVRELITNGTILVDIEGKRVGQANGLSVLEIGGYTFGRPARVTASVAMGQAGIINIERESHLSGNIHDKGVLILSGYLRNRYGQDKPLALSASLCFEQSYSGIEGDSASSAELYALLSRISNIPLRQDIGVTGSVNQWGEVQAVGGVNEKIEGFFDVCRVKGLTGDQGVIIPAANIRNLILKPEVLQAVSEGKFNVYPVRHIDEGVEILTGIRAGEIGEEGTVNEAVTRRLRELALGLKAFAVSGERGEGNGHFQERS